MSNYLRFRIWNITTKSFDYEDSKAFLIGLDGSLYDGLGNPYDENHVIQQWAGLLDKNNKEVYEGDIVSCIEETRVFNARIGFDRVSASFLMRPITENKDEECFRISTHLSSYIEVAGNIFENPELLKQ